ncbi:MAG: hypothetical protein ACRD9R_19430 [Pyrinomonadaceae bacterium]
MFFLGFAESSIQLVPDGTLFLHIAIIIFMVYVLNATLFRPINRILEERERHTRGRSGEAHGILKQIDENLNRYENTLREARIEGYHRLEQGRAAAMQERQSQLEAMRSEMTETIESQKGVITTQTQAARETLNGEAERIAAQITTQILRRPVGESTES